MHGKILRYSISTGLGVITNHSKKIFELRKESWHDSKFLPTVGLFVEFRCDNNSFVITDAKASSYQHFPSNSLIKEIDFWKSESDEELKQKEQDIRSQIVQNIFKETNYFEMKTIQISTSIQDALKQYFAQEFSAINYIIKESSANDSPIINFLHAKRFLLKAMDYLVFADRGITMDTFAEELQKLNRLEYFYKNFTKNININTSEIYEDCFLAIQYDYRGVCKAILSTEERILQLNNKTKNSIFEIKQIKLKLENKKSDGRSLNVKLEHIRAIIAKSEEETRVLKETLSNLKHIADAFRKQYAQSFETTFKRFYELLISKTKEAMNIFATQLDDKIWKIGMNSTAIRNVFFGQNIGDSYCAMTFLGQYLKRLDKKKLINNDKIIYEYYLNFKQKNEKKFLIFTTNQKLEMALKMQIMSISKNYSVVVVRKDSEFYANISRKKFELGYVDPYVDIDLKQLLAEARKSKYNANTHFSVISKEQIALL